ncbi:hypothetical protein SprV_0200582700 [Sparganum proliferum]
MPTPAPVPTTEPACCQQTQSELSNINFRLSSLENKADFLAEQMVALNNSVRQLQATMTDVVSALERGATAADVGPSLLHLPLCTDEAYEDFVRRLTTEAELAGKAGPPITSGNPLMSIGELHPYLLKFKRKTQGTACSLASQSVAKACLLFVKITSWHIDTATMERKEVHS